MSGTLTGAYGKDYKSKKELLADWNAGKDFTLNTYNGQGYVSRREAEEKGATTFQVRWKQNTMVGVIKFSKGEWK